MKVMVNERGQRIGEGHRRAVLSDGEVELLLQDRGPEDAPKMSYAQLARKYRISKSSVRDIITGRRRGQRGKEIERPPAKIANQDRVVIQMRVALKSRHYFRMHGGGRFLDSLVPELKRQDSEKMAAVNCVPEFDVLSMRQIISTVAPVTSRTIWRWIERGIFPAPKITNTRTKYWSRDDVVAWVGNHYRLVLEASACTRNDSKGAHVSTDVTQNNVSAQCACNEVR